MSKSRWRQSTRSKPSIVKGDTEVPGPDPQGITLQALSGRSWDAYVSDGSIHGSPSVGDRSRHRATDRDGTALCGRSARAIRDSRRERVGASADQAGARRSSPSLDRRVVRHSKAGCPRDRAFRHVPHRSRYSPGKRCGGLRCIVGWTAIVLDATASAVTSSLWPTEVARKDDVCAPTALTSTDSASCPTWRITSTRVV